MQSFKILLLCAAGWLAYGTANAQPVFTGNVTFNTQAQLNAWNPAFTSIAGMVFISGADITNLTPLQNITSTEGLSINNNPLLASLNGLNSLQTVLKQPLSVNQCPLLTDLSGLENFTLADKGLAIIKNNGLTSLNGLNALHTANILLTIRQNPMLTSISALSNLTTTGFLDLRDNSALTSLNGLENLVSASNIEVSDHPSLTSIAALMGIQTVRSLRIARNALLPNLNGLDNLHSAVSIRIENNTLLANVDGLSGLTIASLIIIQGNRSLTNLDGLSGVTSMPFGDIGDGSFVSNLIVQDNPNLTNCCGISQLVNTPGAVAGTINIQNNDTGCDNISEITSNCGLCSPDLVPPSIQCPTGLVLNANWGLCTAVTTYPLPTVSDNCPNVQAEHVSGPIPGGATPVGTHVAVWKATDGGGQTATCSLSVTVLDAQPPFITCPANIVRNTAANQCDAVVEYAPPVTWDNCSIPTPEHLSGGLSGQTFPKGSTLVTWRATDGAGLTATCAFSITVMDTQAPNLSCPPNQPVGTNPNQCVATVNFATPAASDNCPLPPNAVVQISGPASGSTFPKGQTTVVFRATDGAGLTKTCSFRIIVSDTQAPTITCPPGQTLSVSGDDCATTVSYATPTASDNCAPAPTVVRIGGFPSGSLFPAGNTVVIWRAIDGAGRSSTCSFTISIQDAQAPSIFCPADVTQNSNNNACTAPVVYPTPTASDNCGIQAINLIQGLASGSVFPLGTTAHTWRALDIHGMTSTCSFTVTVTCQNNNAPETETRSLDTEAGVAPPNFTLSPNPASTEVVVSWEHFLWPEKSADAAAILRVFDATGRVVQQQALSHGQIRAVFEVSNWQAGLYLMALEMGGQQVVKRFVKE